LLCIATGAGAAGCLNMCCEIHRDALMTRTQTRPLAAGRLDPDSARAFGLLLATLSVSFLGLVANWRAAFLLAFTIFFYIVVYTWILKPRTPYNIVIGGLSGALPPLVGWVSSTGTFDWPPIIMVMIIFFWTPAHFWALCLDHYSDFENAGFPMLPSTHGDHHTRRGILTYTLLTFFSSFLLLYTYTFDRFYMVSAFILGSIFIKEAYGVYSGKVRGKRLFFTSIMYLFLLFLSMLIDRFVTHF
jgi:protoheme IX farnesyltransferase